MSDLEKLREFVAPGKRDPHPCVTRCRRIGAAADLDARGVCMECGLPTETNTSPDCELPRGIILALLDCIAAADRWDIAGLQVTEALKGKP